LKCGQNEEWLVGRAHARAESISLVLAVPEDHIRQEIKEEVPELQAPEAPTYPTTR
jgi:hypothetical protein